MPYQEVWYSSEGLRTEQRIPCQDSGQKRPQRDGEKIIMQIDRGGRDSRADECGGYARSEGGKRIQESLPPCGERSQCNEMQDAGDSELAERGFYALIAHISESCQDGEHPAKVVPFSTFVGGFPFASSGFNDGEGYYFAKDTSGGLVIVDTWKRGGDRTNSNFCVMGNSGVGKSTAIKHILLSEYMKGTRIIVIDPESEYRDLCQNLNGDWINAVGGSKGHD